MQSQSISDDYPNTISITQVREDIDSLTRALDKFGKVNVLKGRKVFFEAIDPDFEEKRRQKIRTAAERIKRFAKNYKPGKGEISGTQWIINERDRMRTPEYYADYNR